MGLKFVRHEAAMRLQGIHIKFRCKKLLKKRDVEGTGVAGWDLRIVIDGRINTSAVETLTLFVFLS